MNGDLRAKSPQIVRQNADYPSTPPPESDLINLLDWPRIIWHGKHWIALITFVTLMFGAVYAYQIATPKYTAKAAVALESREAQVVDLETVVSGLSGDQATINTEIEVLRSRVIIGKLALKLGLTTDPEFNTGLQPVSLFSLKGIRQLLSGGPNTTQRSNQAVLDSTVNALSRAISISNIRNSYVFNITAITTDPHKSADIANTLADLYILDQLEVKFLATQQATTWLSERVAELQADLQRANNAVKTLSSNTQLISPEALEALNRQIKDSRDREAGSIKSITAHNAQLSALLVALKTGDQGEMIKAARDATLKRIMVSGAADGTFSARYDLLIQRVQTDLDRAKAQVETLNASITTLEKDYSQQSEDLAKLQQLKREAEASRLIYEYFLGRLKETSVQAGIQKADSRILSHAAVPTNASQPRKSRILALSMVLGLMFGFAFVAARETLNTGFRVSEDIENITGYTVIGQIPVIPTPGRENKVRYLIEKPTSAAAEAVRNLRTSVLLSNLDNPPQVIMMTSSIPGEGKTTTSMALAQNFAGMGRKVLLVEGDIRKRVFTEYFGLPDDNGLLNVISGNSTFKDAVNRVNALGVDVMIGEKSSTNAADVFSSNRFKDFLDEARTRYDIIIIDTPPVLVVPDARIIAQHVDAVLYGVKWDCTSQTQVAEGLRQFETGGVHVAGLILLQIDPKGMKRYGHGDRYGAYSSYGDGYYDT